MKFEKNWKEQTLQILENENWGDPSPNDSHLVRRAMQLRRVPLDRFTTEDLRLMIGQEIGLVYLLPLALEVLKEDLFAEGGLYPGDLLNSTLHVEHSFWSTHKDCWKQLSELIEDRLAELEGHRPRLSLAEFYWKTY